MHVNQVFWLVQMGSNHQPPACRAGALPLSYAPINNRMLVLDMTHPIFTDFRDVRVHTPLRLCYRPGLGGNWIGGQIFGNTNRMDSVNEYLTDGAFFTFDSFTWTWISDHMEPIIDLDKAYGQVRYMIEIEKDIGDVPVVLSHDLPYLSSLVLDYHADETVILESGQHSSWFTYLLCLGKDYLNIDHWGKRSVIGTLLSDNPATGHIDVFAYTKSVHRLSDGMDHAAWLIDTPITWKWYIKCLSDGTNPSDTDRFISYCTAEFIPPLSGWLTRQGDPLLSNIYSSQCYLTAKEGIRDTVLRTVTYEDLFFDLRMPNDGILSGMDPNRLASYTTDNVMIVERMLRLVAGDEKDMLHGMLSGIKERLGEAISRVT